MHIGGDLQIIDLHRKEADIALRLSRPTKEDLVIRTIGQVRYGFFAHKNYIEHMPIDDWQLIEFSANMRLADWIQLLISQHDYKIALSSNDLYVTYSSICEQLGIGILPYFLATKNSDLEAINPVNKTVMSKNDVVKATEDYLSYEVGKDNANAIPLIHSRPLYIVTHPEVRRSARVQVMAQWLGEVLGDGGV